MLNNIEPIAIIGSGAWGTALAQTFAKEGNKVKMYARKRDLVNEINNSRENKTYLPNIKLHENIEATCDHAYAVSGCKIIINVIPTQHTQETLSQFTRHISKHAFIVNASKGIEISSLKLISEIVNDILPENNYAVLSGPTFAEEVALGLPSAVTIASKAEQSKTQELARRLSSKTFRPYVSYDVTGVEIAGAVKNVIAIACGIIAGRKMGNNSKAALMSRGLAEVKRLGIHLGAEPETFLGLSGVGDLTLTCNSSQSRNFSLGFALGEGKTINEIMANRVTVAEGYYTVKAVYELSKRLGVEMPISEAINAVLYDGAGVDEMVKRLLARDLKSEKL